MTLSDISSKDDRGVRENDLCLVEGAEEHPDRREELISVKGHLDRLEVLKAAIILCGERRVLCRDRDTDHSPSLERFLIDNPPIDEEPRLKELTELEFTEQELPSALIAERDASGAADEKSGAVAIAEMEERPERENPISEGDIIAHILRARELSCAAHEIIYIFGLRAKGARRRAVTSRRLEPKL